MKLVEFFDNPNVNTWYLRQDDKNNYIINPKSGAHVYTVKSKVAITRAEYVLIKGEKEIGFVKRAQIGNKYMIGFDESIIAEVEISDEINLSYNGENLYCKPELRSKDFAFYNSNKELIFTIDKSRMSIKDKYKIVSRKNFDERIPFLIAVILDHSFHEGLKF